MSEVVQYCLRDEDLNQVIVRGGIACACADGEGTLFTDRSQAQQAANMILKLNPRQRLIVREFRAKKEDEDRPPPLPCQRKSREEGL